MSFDLYSNPVRQMNISLQQQWPIVFFCLSTSALVLGPRNFMHDFSDCLQAFTFTIQATQHIQIILPNAQLCYVSLLCLWTSVISTPQTDVQGPKRFLPNQLTSHIINYFLKNTLALQSPWIPPCSLDLALFGFVHSYHILCLKCLLSNFCFSNLSSRHIEPFLISL